MATQAIQLPPPFKGRDGRLPTFSLQAPFCERLLNFDTSDAVLKLRKGNGRLAAQAGFPLGLVPYESKLYLVLDDFGVKVYDVTSGTPSLKHSIFGQSFLPIQRVFFNDRVFICMIPFSGSFPPLYFDGTTWGNAGYTFPAGFVPYGGCAYKNRVYFVKRGSAAFGYGPVEGVSGTITEVDLATVLNDNAELYAIKPVSMSENVTAETVLAFIFSSGEILFYSGSYPNSASWQLVARTKVGKPLFYNLTADAKGDTFLITETEILSVRNLLVGGYSQEKAQGIGGPIERRFQQIIQASFPVVAAGSTGAAYVRATYDEKNDRLVIGLPFYIDPETSASASQPMFLVYDFTVGSWTEYTQALVPTESNPGQEVAYLNGQMYFVVGSSGDAVVMKLESEATHVDRMFDNSGTVGIEFEVVSAPHPIQRFGVMKTSGLEAIMKTDIYSAIDFKLIGDLGAQETQPQKTSGNGSNISKTFVNLGIEANTVQYEISGTSTSSSVGIELYATNLWVTPSEGLAR